MTAHACLAIFDPAGASEAFAQAAIASAAIFHARATLGLVAPAPVPGERTHPAHLSTEAFNGFVEAKENSLWALARKSDCEVRVFIDTLDASLDALVKASRCFDIIIVGPVGAYGDREVREMIVEKLLLQSAKPTMLLPDHAMEHAPSKIVVGWNGTREATRALDCALPLLAPQAQIDLISVLPMDSPLSTRTEADDMCIRLSARGYDASARIVHKGRLETAGTLLEKAAAAAADFLVIGGFHHSHLRETLFGGVTRDIIHGDHAIPVLIAH